MCTSFVLYAEKTYIGMNFDISERPIALTLKGGEQFIVLQQDGGRFYPSFGINVRGVFFNLLMVDEREEAKYRRTKDVVHIGRVFDMVLNGSLDVPGLEALLQEKKLVNVPGISVHSMVTGEDRRACVIEPGRTPAVIHPSAQSYLALTNFALSDYPDWETGAVGGVGAERYTTCRRMLSETGQAFSVERGFSILQQTMQTGGDFPTAFSMLAVPEERLIYFSIRRDFTRRYVFSFDDKTIRTAAGFADPREIGLTPKGVLLSELEGWAGG